MKLQVVNLKSPAYKLRVDQWFQSWPPPSAEQSLGHWSLQQLKKAMETDEGFVRGGFFEEELVALLFYRFFADTMEVDFLTTVQGHRRKGYMTMLLESERERIRAQQIWLEVHSGNLSAQSFYSKLGFIQTGQRGSYYQDGASAQLWSWNRVVNSGT